jgi:hypothetical protein
MKEFMSTSTDSSLSPGIMRAAPIREVFLGMDMCLPADSLLSLDAPTEA